MKINCNLLSHGCKRILMTHLKRNGTSENAFASGFFAPGDFNWQAYLESIETAADIRAIANELQRNEYNEYAAGALWRTYAESLDYSKLLKVDVQAAHELIGAICALSYSSILNGNKKMAPLVTIFFNQGYKFTGDFEVGWVNYSVDASGIHLTETAAKPAASGSSASSSSSSSSAASGSSDSGAGKAASTDSSTAQ